MTTNTLLRLALAEKDCPCVSNPNYGSLPLPHPEEACGCCENICHGTGRVPLMPGLREECPCITAWDTSSSVEMIDKSCGYYGPCEAEGGHTSGCLSCQGRGWVVTTNAETVAQSLWGVLKGLRDTVQKFDYRWYMGAGHFDEAWEAAACALEEAGLMEKETQ